MRKAASMGANGVVGIDFETSEILEGFIVITAVGTAVLVE
ncbi:MAG: heavy metal-binding domain-containing protein [Thermoproteota archaeon]